MSFVVLLKDLDGRTVGQLLAEPKAFRSGSSGYYGQTKLTFGGKRYQAQVQLVEIRPKEGRNGQ